MLSLLRLLKSCTNLVWEILRFTVNAFLRFAQYPSISAQRLNNVTMEQWQSGFIKLSKHTLISYLIVSTVLVGSGIIFLFNPFGGGIKQAEAAWFNDNWSYRKIIPITANTGVDTASYVAVTLTNTNTLVSDGQLQSDCGDMRFTKFGGEILPYYISSGCNSASTVVHVYFDTLPAGASDFYFYYGNPSAVNGFSATAFSTAAVSVTVGTVGSEEKAPSPTGYWKFDDAQGTTAQDSTSNNYDGTLSGTPTWRTEDGCISGKCLRFSGSSQHVSTTTTGSLVTATAGTMSVWVKPRGTSPTATDVWDIDGIFADAGGDMGIYRGIIGGLDRIWIYNYDGNQDLIGITYNTNEWVQISWVHTGGTLYAYKNGNLISSTASGNTDLNNPIDIGKGMDAGANGTFEGDIDEVKIYRNGLSAAQILANYNARSNPEGVSSALGANTQNMPGALSNGLTGYWKMDESSWTGDCSTDSALDSSGNSLHGDACPNASAPSPGAGKFGNGGNFDGTNDYISIPDGSSVEPSGDMTLSAWVKFDTLPGAGVDDKIVFKYEAISPFVGYEITYNGDGYFYLARENAAQDYEFAFYTITAATNTWYHIVGTKRADKVHLFVNSVYNESESGSSSGLLYNTSGVLAIGSTSTGNYLDGTIDEVRLYNRSLSNNEIAQLYNWAPGPVGYWKMDEGSYNGTSGEVKDSSGGGNNGTFAGTFTNASSAGKYGKAANFNGTNNSVAVTSTANFPTTDMTFETWVNVGQTATEQYFISIDDGVNGQTWLGLNAGGTVSFAPTGNNLGGNLNSTSTVTAQLWTHIVGVRNNNNMSVYINGVKDSSTGTNSQSVNYGGVCATHFGAAANTSCTDVTYALNAMKLDEIKIYNYARSQAQIIEDMNAGHPAPGSPVGTPLGYWKFDQGADNTCSGGTNDACNSGSGGTTYDGANTSSTWTQNGKFGKAYSYNGSSGRVDFGDFTALETATQASWSFWVRPTTLATSQALLVKANNAATQQSWSIMTDSSTSTAIRVRIASGATDQSNYGVTPTGVLANNTWAYVTVIYDGGQSGNASKLKVYVNGLPQTLTFTGTIPTTLRATTSSMRSGAWSDAGGTFFNGILDEMKVFTQPLTASQVLLDMNGSQAQVMGAISDSSTAGNDNASTRTANSAASEYCIPGDASTCTAPVVRHDFEENNILSTIRDTSGNGNDAGTIFANTYKFVPGKVGAALQDGADGGSDVGAATSTSVDDLPAAGMTVEGWINPRSMGQSSQGVIMVKASGTTTSGWAFMFNSAGTNGLRFFQDYATTDLVRLTADNVITLNTWNHVAVTWTGSTTATTVKIYVNGREVTYGTTTDGLGARQSDAAQYLAMFNDSGQGSKFAGKMDQMRVYNYVRTPAQIAWDMNRGAPIAHWKMDECQGTTFNDSSGNGYSGTWSGSGAGTYTSSGTCSVSSASSFRYNGATGKRNYSMAFDGTDDYITVSGFADAIFTSNYTQAFWIKTTQSGNTVISEKGSNNAFIQTNNGQIRVGTTNNLADDTLETTLTNLITDGNWHHVAASFNSTTKYEAIYIDGRLSTSRTTTNNSASSATAYVIGSRSGVAPFSGQIDDFRVYIYDLTPTQLKTLYNDGATRYGPVTGAP